MFNGRQTAGNSNASLLQRSLVMDEQIYATKLYQLLYIRELLVLLESQPNLKSTKYAKKGHCGQHRSFAVLSIAFGRRASRKLRVIKDAVIHGCEHAAFLFEVKARLASYEFGKFY